QWTLGARFADPAFLGSPWSLSASFYYADARDFFGNRQVSFESPGLVSERAVTDYAVVAYKRLGGTLGAGHDLAVATRLSFDYRLERIAAIVPTVASHLRGATREPIDFDIEPGVSVLSELRAGVVYDTRDTPFLPKRGVVTGLQLGAGLTPLGSSYGFAKAEAELRAWWSLPWSHVVGLHAEVGAIFGSPPFFERFYVGDYTDLLPDRVFGLNPDRRQPPNYLGTDIAEVRYGDYAARLAGEYRIPLYAGTGSVYGVDLFALVGVYAVAAKRDLVDPPSGYSGAALAPLDLTYNLGFRVETYVGGFSLAFSNLLGLLPGRGGDRK
ncbi:MAG: BamA/TamA family outer membrane protein, partial [Polyangiaceae bacterium]|nr:BamA/TamA family outer membrane protein [Polyangiaceae bacterium]